MKIVSNRNRDAWLRAAARTRLGSILKYKQSQPLARARESRNLAPLYHNHKIYFSC